MTGQVRMLTSPEAGGPNACCDGHVVIGEPVDARMDNLPLTTGDTMPYLPCSHAGPNRLMTLDHAVLPGDDLGDPDKSFIHQRDLWPEQLRALGPIHIAPE